MWRLRPASRAAGPLLFLKARNAWWLPVLAAATVLVGLMAPDGLVDVPLRRDVKTILNVVVIGLPASLSTMYLRRPSSHVELGVSRLVHTRCVWWAGSYVAIVSCAAMSLASWGGLTGGAVGLRPTAACSWCSPLSARAS